QAHGSHRGCDDERRADAPRHSECAASSAHRAWQRLHRHGGERFAATLWSDAQDDEKRRQNEKDDGANGTNENLTWQFQSDYAEKGRRIALITKWWWPIAAARATENSLR